MVGDGVEHGDDWKALEWERQERVERGEEVQTRIMVEQSGEIVGTVPWDFQPSHPGSRNPMYDARPGDFRFEGDKIVANNMLGMGDLMSVPGFAPMRQARGPIPLEDIRQAALGDDDGQG